MSKRNYKEIIKEYENSVDENLLMLFEDIRSGKTKATKPFLTQIKNNSL